MIGAHDGMIHALIPGVVGLVRQLDVAQVLHVVGPFPAGHDHPDRVALLDAHRLAILAVGHEQSSMALASGTVWLNLPGSAAFINQPTRLFFHAGHRSTMRTAARRSIRCCSPSRERTGPATPCWRCPGTMDHGRAVGMALHEMNAGHRRQSLQVVHAEAQRTVHQAVNGEAMLCRDRFPGSGTSGTARSAAGPA